MELVELSIELARTPSRAGSSKSIWPDNETMKGFSKI